MLPLLRPYVLAACQMRKQKNKKKNLSNIVKRINCDFIYQLKKLKKQNKTKKQKNWLYSLFPGKYLKKIWNFDAERSMHSLSSSRTL